ncbi:MAG: sodium-translocating pyrophosphatase [Eubacteriales bacterium]|nr:sodium-translocating pyrophosphatase [Eubacteriales bacterium]
MTVLKIAAIVCAFVGLFVAYSLLRWVGSLEIENEDMRAISKKIKEASKAFLLREYKGILTLIIILFIFITIALGFKISISYLAGVLISMISGYLGVSAAVKGNARTASIATTQGLKSATKVAFRSGAVMGLSAAGLGLAGVSIVYFIFGTNCTYYIVAFALGASTVSLMSRIGGGIYVKAADVGSEVVGRIEEDLQEDDPRNPAMLADKVGKSVGGVTGIGLDMLESYMSAIIAAIVIAIIMPSVDPELGAAFEISAVGGSLFPIAMASIGILSSIIGIFVVRGSETSNPAIALTRCFLVSESIVIVSALILSGILFGNVYCGLSVIVGILAGIGVGKSITVFTSEGHKNFSHLMSSSSLGSGTLTVFGIALGMMSTVFPILCITATIVIANYFAGIYGVALAAVGMTANMAISVAINACGPIAYNARGIAETTGVPNKLQAIVGKLKLIGAETIKIERGVAIASTAVTAFALFIIYIQVINMTGGEQYAGFSLNLMNPIALAGLLIGGIIPFVVSALTMNAVGKAARNMIYEVRRQFKKTKEMPGSEIIPDYAKCVDVSTKAAINQMLLPGVMVMATPILVGILLGCEALGGMIAGAICTGVILSTMMLNSGEAWNNVKHKLDYTNRGKSVDETYKAAVAGDLLGDTFRDITGPAINIVIKLVTIISIVFSALFIKVGGLINFL